MFRVRRHGSADEHIAHPHQLIVRLARHPPDIPGRNLHDGVALRFVLAKAQDVVRCERGAPIVQEGEIASERLSDSADTLRCMRTLGVTLLALVGSCGGQTHDESRVPGDGAVEGFADASMVGSANAGADSGCVGLLCPSPSLFDAAAPPEDDASGDESQAAACPDGEVLCPTYCTNPVYSICVAIEDGGCGGPPWDCPQR